MSPERRTRKALVRATRAMRARGLVTSTVGNISARLGDDILITPTRRDPDDLKPSEIVRLGLDGTPTRTPRLLPSLEWRMHVAVYLARPDVGAIAHTHSPYAVARSFEVSALIVETEERRYLALNRIEVAPPHPAGSGELAGDAVRALGHRRAALLSRHGVLGVGVDPRDAVDMCHTVEHLAQISLLLARAEDARELAACGS